ncbi:SAM-dependent methyltransferase [Streptomyces europaeiscabiei]|uniref:SAM-dependent methyltransferase n=1 Tax=Streptomyces europaeiscabiei TaxID=146819 RepID=UPI0038F81574
MDREPRPGDGAKQGRPLLGSGESGGRRRGGYKAVPPRLVLSPRPWSAAAVFGRLGALQSPHAWEAVAGAYGGRGSALRPRSRAEVLRFFRGLDLADPGLVTAHRWRPPPAGGPGLVTDQQVSVYAGVARKPAA